LNDLPNTSGQQFLKLLGIFPEKTFEGAFTNSSTRLGLGALFDGDALALLFDAAFRARLCNIAFNGLGGCRGQIKPERELHRIHLEREFMVARDAFQATAGWQAFSEAQRWLVQSAFFHISVGEVKLAV
jgi:hypothetical protein